MLDCITPELDRPGDAIMVTDHDVRRIKLEMITGWRGRKDSRGKTSEHKVTKWGKREQKIVRMVVDITSLMGITLSRLNDDGTVKSKMIICTIQHQP